MTPSGVREKEAPLCVTEDAFEAGWDGRAGGALNAPSKEEEDGARNDVAALGRVENWSPTFGGGVTSWVDGVGET